MVNDLDTILNADDSVTPSPGFAASVMRAVRRYANFTLPIQFPWLRFAACLIMGLVCLICTIAIVLVADLSNLAFQEMAPWVQTMHQILANEVLYATLFLIGCLFVIRLTMEFTSE